MYRHPFAERREKKESKRDILLTIWSTVWRTAIFLLFICGGAKVALWGYENYPAFPMKFIVGFAGAVTGATAFFLLIILPMGGKGGKR